MTTKMIAEDLIKMTRNGVGVTIAYPGDPEPFHVQRAEENEYGAIQIFDYLGRCHGLGSLWSAVEVLGTYNL